MPVTKSAKKALRTATRRHAENLIQREAYKKAVKGVKKAIETGSSDIATLFSQAQSSLDRAAKNHTMHPNKAARLKSRLAKKMATSDVAPAAKKVVAKKATTAKTPAKKAAAKKSTTKKSSK